MNKTALIPEKPRRKIQTESNYHEGNHGGRARKWLRKLRDDTDAHAHGENLRR